MRMSERFIKSFIAFLDCTGSDLEKIQSQTYECGVGGGGGGGGRVVVLGSIFAGYVPLSSKSPNPNL